ncbi:hypothetical protein ONZ45_g15329 [Pleurotus djamor]|nr:hypothetical protein ONZ45_g15329 [Pleurotus djamor]
MVTGFRSEMNTAELLSLRIRQLEKREEDLEAAADTLRQMRCRSLEQFLKRYKHRIQKEIYDPGEFVVIRNNRHEESLSALKTRDRYIGPFKIVKRTDRNNYVLQELNGTLMPDTVAAFRVLKYFSRDDPALLEMLDDPGSDIESDESPENSETE